MKDLEKIEEQLKGINESLAKLIEFMIEQTKKWEQKMEEMEKKEPPTIEVRQRTIWDDLRIMSDTMYRQMLLDEAKKTWEEGNIMIDAERKQFLKRIIAITEFKKKMDEYLSEDGILKLKEELEKEENKWESTPETEQ